MMRRGDTGDEIKELQRQLRLAGQDTGPLDGIFGPKTEAAVKAFQEAEGLAADGIVGPNTAGAIEKAVAAAQAKAAKGGLAGFKKKDEDDLPGNIQ